MNKTIPHLCARNEWYSPSVAKLTYLMYVESKLEINSIDKNKPPI